MINLINANLYRLKKDYSFYILLFINIIVSFYYVYNAYKNRLYYILSLDDVILSYVKVNSIISSIYMVLYMMREYLDNITLNKISLGYKRSTIYINNLLHNIFISLLFFIVFLISLFIFIKIFNINYYIFTTNYLDNINKYILPMIHLFIIVILTIISLVSLYSFIFYIIRRVEVSSIILILMPFLLILVNLNINNYNKVSYYIEKIIPTNIINSYVDDEYLINVSIIIFDIILLNGGSLTAFKSQDL